VAIPLRLRRDTVASGAVALAIAVTAGASGSTAGDTYKFDYRPSLVCPSGDRFGPPLVIVHVIDAWGSEIPGAAVKAEWPNLPASNGTTDTQGRLVLKATPVGRFRVEIKVMGFVTAEATDLRTERGCTTALIAPILVGGLGSVTTHPAD
jgi:hypothetical protein